MSPSTQAVGDAWMREQRSLALRVPSSAVPSEWNYLLNPRHPDMDRLRIDGPIDPRIDDRPLSR